MSSWNRIRNRLMADRRKLGVMAMLLCVAMLLWGRLLMTNVPRTAVADPSAIAAAAAAEATGGSMNVATDKPLRPPVEIPDYGPISRDLFAFQPVYYGISDRPEKNSATVSKLDDEQADELRQQQQLRMAVLSAAKHLRLQSTLLGSVNRAMINGVLLEPGQTILGFELQDVRSRQVTLTRDGIEVTLEM